MFGTMKITATLAAAAAFVLGGVWLLAGPSPDNQKQRDTWTKAFQAGNFKDAFEGLKKMCLDPDDDPFQVGKDLDLAVQALQRLGRVEEADDFRESVIKVHETNWRLLAAAADNYANKTEHHGFIVAGKFNRGTKRGGARYVNALLRDRTRALQLMQEAHKLIQKENDKIAASQFYMQFAQMIMYAGNQQAWRLQYLTDLSKLPDYEDGYTYYRNNHQGAPVDADGNPVYHTLPKSYEAAESDGQRWRWALARAVELDSTKANEADKWFADFHLSQFGVQTMAYYGYRFDPPTPPLQKGGQGGVKDQEKSGTYALHTLTDGETIARLASGIKRFKLPDEFNYIKVYERIIGRGRSNEAEHSYDNLAQEYENRRQYPRAAQTWQKFIDTYGAGQNNYRGRRLEQIVQNWGRFEPNNMQALEPLAPGGERGGGEGATVEYRFRNGKKVTFEAHAIKVNQLLDDVKAYLRSNPRQIDWNQVQLGNIGYRLVELNQNQYLGEKVATWDMDLKPRPDHVDARVTVTAPMTKPGAYLVTAKMANGNESRIILWLTDTIILKKQLDGQMYYYVADAATGTPVSGAKVEFFGWMQEQTKPNANEFRVDTKQFTTTADNDGQVITTDAQQPSMKDNRWSWQWLVTARSAKNAEDERFAFLGFTNVWYGRAYDPEYNQTKVFSITDRPVYRPEQVVQFKTWVEHAQYDQPNTAAFAGKTFLVRIHNPKGEKVYEKSLTADEYGGIADEYLIPKGGTLGVYGLQVWENPTRMLGGNNFRVEEYKKPEFEVTVEAPKEPVQLGDKIEATIQAKYYFGAPVVNAKVKFKVMRQEHTARWYPRGDWDWMYGRGYWWFSPEFPWYPGFSEWGCLRPIPWWWGGRQGPPEMVMEQEVPIGADSKVKVTIDTAIAKELHGNQDHKYSITAEVTDQSRRTIVGSGDVLVSRKPFQVYTWLDRGHYRAGDTIHAFFNAQTLDQKSVEGKGELTLYKISYPPVPPLRKGGNGQPPPLEKEGNGGVEPVEKAVETWKLDTTVEGRATQQIKAAQAGQYRLSYKVTDAKNHTIEGGYLFVVRGDAFTGKSYRFNDIELIADKREYEPGQQVKLMINTNQNNGTVLLFARPSGVYQKPQVIRLDGKSTERDLIVVQRDMPNFFVEAVTIHGGRVHSEMREIIVPPEKRVINVAVEPSQQEYKPGQEATVKVKLTDHDGKPFIGSTVVSIYDKSVDYIAGGSNIPEIKEFFWKWRRHHYPQTESSLQGYFGQLLRRGEIGMANLGVFGEMVVEELAKSRTALGEKGGQTREEAEFSGRGGANRGLGLAFGAAPAAGPAGAVDGLQQNAMFRRDADRAGDAKGAAEQLRTEGQGKGEPAVGPEPTIRKNFADTAYWNASLTTDKNGVAQISLKMPEQLTGWKVRVWAMGLGTKVGQGEAEVVTKKDLIVRLQAPRFFTQKDEVVLSANVHNYLKAEKKIHVYLELQGGTLAVHPSSSLPIDSSSQAVVRQVTIPAGGEQRVDWRVNVINEGEAIVRMKAVCDEDSDAMEMRFPCYIHGMLKMESFTGVIRPEKQESKTTFVVPAERRVEQSRLEVRYSPTLAGAMVDALPYMVDYPYGCTEQTLNRFLPTVITQRILQKMNIDLKEVEKHQTNLNSQEIGDDKERQKQWKRFKRNPVFSEEEVKEMVNAGINALASMQLSDGGWGWFSGFGEHSFPHTTATVVHGLQIAQQNDVGVPAQMLVRGLDWLKNYQDDQTLRLRNFPTRTIPYKEHADNMDALVYMVLADGKIDNQEMRGYLYRDRNFLSVYAKAQFGLALHKLQDQDKLAMIMKNIEQYVVQDAENQTAYLRLPPDTPWWVWWGSEIESDAYYLKLLSLTNARDEKAAGLVKYLLNNRKHSTYWESTRDTAICIEAMADYWKNSGEDRPDMNVEVWLDGKKYKDVYVDHKNLFTFDNKLILEGDKISAGKHTLEIKRRGSGPVYWNAYQTNFTLEDFITKAGLEVRVNRKYYRLDRIDEKIKVSGSKGQALDQKIEKYKRTELENLATLKSGDLVEIELEIDSKNDYEYVIIEDPKAAGFEPLAIRSGYTYTGLGAYMEVRDEKIAFFARVLPRGKHSITYRMRAEIPGQFSALPTRAYAMYAPELKGNSDEIKIRVRD